MKEFVRYFSIPGRLFPRVICLRSKIPPKNADFDLIVLEEQVELHVLQWLVDHWPPYDYCDLLGTGSQTLKYLENSVIGCKICQYELRSINPHSAAMLFMRRVHRILHDADFEAPTYDIPEPISVMRSSSNHDPTSIAMRLLGHPVVGPVLHEGDPDSIIRLAQHVTVSLRSLYDL